MVNVPTTTPSPNNNNNNHSPTSMSLSSLSASPPRTTLSPSKRQHSSSLSTPPSSPTRSPRSSPRKRFQNDEPLEIAIDEAEKAFVEGHFHKALTQANRCLQYASQQQQQQQQQQDDYDEFAMPSSHMTTTTASLTEPWIERTCTFYLDLPNGTSIVWNVALDIDNDDMNHVHNNNNNKAQQHTADWTDRAGAIALQSWYEYDKEQRQCNQTPPSFQLLEPLWKVFSSNNDSDVERLCSLELTLVLLQFVCHCPLLERTCTHAAMECVCGIIAQIATLRNEAPVPPTPTSLHPWWERDQPTTTISTTKWPIYHEYMWFLFTDMLPYCTSAELVAKGLQRFEQAEWQAYPNDDQDDDGLERKRSALSSMLGGTRKGRNVWKIQRSESGERILNVAACKAVIQFLENPPIYWPSCESLYADPSRPEDQDILGECRWQLEALVRLHSQTNSLLKSDHHGSVNVETVNSLDSYDATGASLDEEDKDNYSVDGDRNLLNRIGVVETTRSRLQQIRGTYFRLPRMSDRSPLQSIPTLGGDGSLEQWTRRILYFTRVFVVEPLVLSENRWENQKKTMVGVLVSYIGWKQRRRVYKGSKFVLLRLVLRPFMEILKATLGLAGAHLLSEFQAALRISH